MRRSFSRSWAYNADVFVIALLLFTAAPLHAQWVAVKAGQYEVFSDLGAKKALEAAAALQKMTAAVAHGSELRVTFRNPTRVLIFGNRTDFMHHAAPLFGGRLGKAGVAVTSTTANYILLDGNATRAGDVLFHELAHQFINNSMINIPLWFSEGLADFYAHHRVERNAVEVGRPIRPQQRLRLTKQKLIPMREFFLADAASPLYNEGAFERKYYSQAWAVVHKLMHEKPAELEEFVLRLRGGQAVDDAFLASFHITLQRFERDLQLYLQRPILPSKRVQTGPIVVDPCSEPRAVGADEMQALLADLASVGRR